MGTFVPAIYPMAVSVSELRLISGAFLAGGLLLGLVAVGMLIATGALQAFPAQLRGSLEQVGQHGRVFAVGNILWAAAWSSVLIGFGMLAHLLSQAGDPYLAKVSLVVITVAVVLALIEATFGFTVTPWATREAVAIGATPEIYTALRRWTNGIQVIYIVLGLTAQAGFGIALLQTGLLPSWIGRFTLFWSVGWLAVLGLGIPAIVLIAPAVIGVALLVA